MILKFKSHPMYDRNDMEDTTGAIFPGYDWTWLDGVTKVQIIEDTRLPDIRLQDSVDQYRQTPAGHYLEAAKHYADTHWVGMNPHIYNDHGDVDCKRDPIYRMCYIWKTNGKIELLAIGFLAEVYVLNDEGKTIDKIENPAW